MEELKVLKKYATNNPCYKIAKTMNVQGIMIHSTGTPDRRASFFADFVNKANRYTTCPHAYIDEENGVIHQVLPWNYKGRHCEGSGDNTHIAINICEPKGIKYETGYKFSYDEKDLPKILESFKTTYEAAVKLCANLCKLYDLDPSSIVSHHEAYSKKIASNRGDVDHLWSQVKCNYTMDSFRAAVKETMETLTTLGETIVDPLNPNADQKKFYKVRKDVDDSISQIGAYEDVQIAKAVCDLYPGYKVFDPDGKLVYPLYGVPIRFQIKSGEKKLNIYKTPNSKGEQRDIKLGPGIFTIVEIQNGSNSKKGYGLLKAYKDRGNGFVNIDDIKHFIK